MRLTGHGRWMTVCGVALVLAEASPAGAQQTAPARPGHQARPAPLHVVVAPSGRLYRQCVDHPVVEHRPSGDTVVPSFACRWAVRP